MYFGPSDFSDLLVQTSSFSSLLVRATSFSNPLVQQFRSPLFPGKRKGLDRQESSLSVLTPRVWGGFRWSSVFKTLEPISLPPTDTLRPREKSTKARRKMGALSQYPTAAVSTSSIIECDLWWANFPPFQLTDETAIGAGYSLPSASAMASYRRGPSKWLPVAAWLSHWSRS